LYLLDRRPRLDCPASKGATGIPASL
jgi:hypothetical protein